MGEDGTRSTDDHDSKGLQASEAQQRMPWRTEPEIDEHRQQFLGRRRKVRSNEGLGIYPFRDENGPIRLTRADVEWLLATHESDGMCGPVDSSDDKQNKRKGLNLRGADLSHTDLSGLPLARLRGSLYPDDATHDDTSAADKAAITLTGANLRDAHLEEARLVRAHLEDADLHGAWLMKAELYNAFLVGARLGQSHLAGASLRRAVLSSDTNLYGAQLCDDDHGTARLRDVRWNGADLSVIDWSLVVALGDEQVIRTRTKRQKNDYPNALRANRQLALVLRSQGLNEDSDRFAYRAQVLQRQVLWRQGRLAKAAGSWLLDAVSGYGYKPIRSVYTYLLVVLCFAAAYYALTNVAISPIFSSHSSPLVWYEAIVLSISSFHGRGLFPTGLSLGDPIAILAAFEAITGLLIEITFIATFTQRFFAK